jgi:hypothetical protein
MMRAVKISRETVIPKVSGEENALPVSATKKVSKAEVVGEENPTPLSIAKETLIPEISGKEVSPPITLWYEAYKQ